MKSLFQEFWLSSAVGMLLVLPCLAADFDPLMNMGLDVPAETRNSYNQAIKLQTEGNYEEAASRLADVVRAVPNFIPAHLAYAASLEKLGKLSESVAELESAARVKPDEQTVLLSLARAYQISGRRTDAIKQFERYIWLYPDGDDADYVKNAVSQMKLEEGKRDIFTDTRGQDNYLAEILVQKAGRWKAGRMPLAIFIHSGACKVGYKPELDILLRQAFSDWSNASGGKISFVFVDKADNAAIECRWTDDIRDFDNPIEAGETRTFARGPELRSANIVLLCGGKARSATEIKGVCLHEIGHSLGIFGHSSDPADIMFMFSRSGDKRSNQLSSRDIKTIVLLYSIPEAELGKYHGQSYLAQANGAELLRLSNLAETCFKGAKFAEAVRYLETALKLDPTDHSIHENLGSAYANLGRQELRSREYIKYQKHFELAAGHFKSAGNRQRAADLYEALAKFSTLMQDESSASLYRDEAVKLRRFATK